MTLEGISIWITGASSGIGEALARVLSREGANLILSARRGDALENIRQSLERAEHHRVVALDLASPESIQAAVDVVQTTSGIPQILINNGGISQRSKVMETSLTVDRAIMEVNFFGTVALTKALLPGMVARKSGHIVVISSVVGKFGTPYRTAYSASKHALHGFFDSLRAELFDDNITITLVCPGYVQTNISINALAGDGSAFGEMDDATAHGMTPDSCARAIVSALKSKKEEVSIGGKEVIGIYLKRFLPSVFSKVIRKVKVR